MKETAIYIHIPFCDHKCIYCDFYSLVSYKNISSYLVSLKKEIDFYAQKYSRGRKIISIFFGGGTPSFMETEYIAGIIEYVTNKFFVLDDAEITLETNPGTVDKNKLTEFRKAGVNRISIGIQSFNDEELKFLTRIHDSNTAVKTVKDAVESGFENISIDLIFNLPGQSKEIWQSNLEMAVLLPVMHISAYSLILEHGTILNKMVLDGKVKIQDEDHDADLYETTIEHLAMNNYNQYEVSNFAHRGFECIHNNAYWRYKDYLGFGTSAHSFIEGRRWWNFSSLNFYNAAVEKKNYAAVSSEILTEEEMLNEYVMLALRSKGLDINDLETRFGNNWLARNTNFLDNLCSENFLIMQNDMYSFTPKGYAVCDEILTKFKS